MNFKYGSLNLISTKAKVKFIRKKEKTLVFKFDG